MTKLLYLFFVVLISVNEAKIVHFKHPIKDKNVTQCIRKITETIVEHDHFITDVTLMNTGDVEISGLHGMKKVRYISRLYAFENDAIHNHIYIVSCEDFKELKEGLKQASEHFYFNPTANYIIVMNKFHDQKQNVTDLLVFRNVYNVTILAKADDGYAIYTFRSPIHPCNHREELVAVSYCSSYNGGSYIFPVIENIRGCTFKIIGHNFFPMINFDNKDEEGIEQTMLKLFEEYAGISIDLLEYSKLDRLGRVVGNFTYIDIGIKLMNNEAEGAIGGYFLTLPGLKQFSAGYPLIIDNMILIMPRANYLNTWLALFQESHNVVVLIFISIIIFWIFAFTLSLFPTRQADPVRDLLIVLGLYMNRITLKKIKNGVPETLLASSLIFAVFMLPYIMQAFNCSINTHPLRGREPKDFDEITANYKIIVYTDFLRVGLTKYRRECTSWIECLTIVRDEKDKSYYTLIAQSFYRAFKWMVADEYCNLGLYEIRINTGFLMRTVLLRRGSVLVQPFDDYIFRVMSAGIIDHHFKKILYKERQKCKSHHKPENEALKLKDFKVSFAILIIGYCLSAVSFAYEISTR